MLAMVFAWGGLVVAGGFLITGLGGCYGSCWGPPVINWMSLKLAGGTYVGAGALFLSSAYTNYANGSDCPPVFIVIFIPNILGTLILIGLLSTLRGFCGGPLILNWGLGWGYTYLGFSSRAEKKSSEAFSIVAGFVGFG